MSSSAIIATVKRKSFNQSNDIGVYIYIYIYIYTLTGTPIL